MNSGKRGCGGRLRPWPPERFALRTCKTSLFVPCLSNIFLLILLHCDKSENNDPLFSRVYYLAFQVLYQ